MKFPETPSSFRSVLGTWRIAELVGKHEKPCVELRGDVGYRILRVSSDGRRNASEQKLLGARLLTKAQL
jgi:hypothetical protein